MTADGGVEPLPAGLQAMADVGAAVRSESAFTSAIDAREELEKVFERNDDLGAPSALEAFLASYHERVEIADPAAQPSTRPPVAPEGAAAAPEAQQSVSETPATSDPLWPETRHAATQEPLRDQPTVREPIAVTSLREPPESQSLASKLNPAVDFSPRPLQSYTSMPYAEQRHEEKESPTTVSNTKAADAARRSREYCFS